MLGKWWFNIERPWIAEWDALGGDLRNNHTRVKNGSDVSDQVEEGDPARHWVRHQQYPYAPCMVYLPTFGWFLGQMLVNIPYMEHMRYGDPLHQGVSVGMWWHQQHRSVSEPGWRGLQVTQTTMLNITVQFGYLSPWSKGRIVSSSSTRVRD